MYVCMYVCMTFLLMWSSYILSRYVRMCLGMYVHVHTYTYTHTYIQINHALHQLAQNAAKTSRFVIDIKQSLKEVCMYICVCVHVCICIHISRFAIDIVYVCVCMCVYICMYSVRVYVCIHISSCWYVCVCV